MSQLPLISVIVPAYNAEAYLVCCLDSILCQTYKNIEAVVVDDGSVDGTAEICDRFAKKNKRIKVIHQQNSGSTAARFAGVVASCGEFVMFVDADDWIDDDYVERAVSLMGDDVDVVSLEQKENIIMEAEAYGNWLLRWHGVQLWGKLFRRSLVCDSWVFDIDRSIKIAEDFLINLKLLRNVKQKVCVSKQHGYHYRQVNGSLIHSFRASPDYETKVKNLAVSAIQQLPLNLTEGSVIYQIGMLQHQIVWKAAISAEWLAELRELAESVDLSCFHKLILEAADNKFYAFVLRVFNPFYKICRYLKRKIDWRDK